MNKSTIILAFISLTILASCRSHTSPTTSLENYNISLYTPSYASGFEIKGAGGKSSTLINALNPWQGADSITSSLFIARDGEVPPDGFNGTVIDHTPERIIVMSGTYIAMLDLLDSVDKIVGVSGIDYISNEYITQHRDKIGDVGYEGNIDYEKLLSLDPDLVMLYGLYSASPMEPRLKELGIPYIYIGDYVEQSPLGKSEWLIAFGEIIDKRTTSEIRFDSIATRYNMLRDMVSDHIIEAPTVMVNTPYGNTWYMPSADSYVVTLITDAGGKYIYDKVIGSASSAIDLEEAYALTSMADMWLDVGQCKSLEDLAKSCPKFTDTRCFMNGYVYNNNRQSTPSGGNLFYETAIITPDLVLRDLTKIFHPELISDDFVYYKQLK